MGSERVVDDNSAMEPSTPRQERGDRLGTGLVPVLVWVCCISVLHVEEGRQEKQHEFSDTWDLGGNAWRR